MSLVSFASAEEATSPVVLVPLLVGVALAVCFQKFRVETHVRTLQDLLSFLPRSGQKIAVFTSALETALTCAECHGLRNANPHRISTKVACKYCLRDLH